MKETKNFEHAFARRLFTDKHPVVRQLIACYDDILQMCESNTGHVLCLIIMYKVHISLFADVELILTVRLH